MGAIISLGMAVMSTIGSAIVAVGAAIAAAAVAITHAIAAVALAIGSVIAGTIGGVLAGLGIASTATVVSALNSIGLLNVLSATVFSGVTVFLTSVVAAWQAFTNFIHLDILLKVHKIAYFVSEDYRNMMRKVYKKIGEVSSKLHLGANFMIMAIRNARTFVMDASTIMGRNYDLSEVVWLRDFDRYMKSFAIKAEKYKEDPGRLLFDIDNKLVRPAIELKSKVMLGIYNTIDNVVNASEQIVGHVDTLKTDIQQFVDDLPSKIRDQIKPYVDEKLAIFDEFMSEKYLPVMSDINQVVDTLTDRQSAHKLEMDGLVDQLKYPGTLMDRISLLRESERIREEDLISDVTTRSYRRDVSELESVSAPTHTRLARIREALDRTLKPLVPGITELPAPAYPAGEQFDDDKTWFVGDY